MAPELVWALVGRKTQQGEYSSHCSLRKRTTGRVLESSLVLEKIIGRVLISLLVVEKKTGRVLKSLLTVEKMTGRVLKSLLVVEEMIGRILKHCSLWKKIRERELKHCSLDFEKAPRVHLFRRVMTRPTCETCRMFCDGQARNQVWFRPWTFHGW